MRYHEIVKLNENASSGATSSAAVATSVTPFFGELVTQNEKDKKKEKKVVVLKRIPSQEYK